MWTAGMQAATVLALLSGAAASTRSTITDCPGRCECYETSDSHGVYVDCKNQQLTEIPDTFPSNTRVLDLSHNQIEFINELPDMDELITLNLTSNKVRGIHYDAFDGLDSLLTLVLSHNELTSIDDDIFEWNPLKLRHIYLDNNRFEYIQHFLFYDLGELEEISLANNKLSFVHPHAFTELEDLRMLDLSGNNLDKFQTKWIKPLLGLNLVELKVGGNKFSCDCDMEDKLDFFKDDNMKALLQSALYRGHSELKCNGITDKNIGKSMFDITSSDLTSCQKPTISGISKSSSVLSGKSLLLKCVTSGTPKPTVDWRAPNDDVYRLTSDDFEGVTVHQDGSMLIEDIRTSDAGDYHCIAKNSQGQTEAKTTVEVTGTDSGDHTGDRDDPNNGWDLNDDYTADNQHWMNLNGDGDYNLYDEQGNKLGDDDYEMEEVDLSPVETVWHETKDQDCPRDCDCESDIVDCSDAEDMERGIAFTTMPSMIPRTATHLDLNVNKISHLGPDICRNYKQLQELKLDENEISTIDPNAFRDCINLRILTLRNNQISKLPPQAFADLNKVQILVLDNNFLEEITDFAFTGMRELEYLYIRENRIHTIGPNAFHGLGQIRFIHLEENKIDSLAMPWIKDAVGNSELKRIFLEDNTLVCDDRLKPYKDELTRSENRIYKVIQPPDLECRAPVSLYGMRLDTIVYEDLVVVDVYEINQPGGDTQTGSAGLLIGGIFLGIVLTALIFVVWRKWNRGHRMRGMNYSSLDINDHTGDERATLTGHSDQEAFI